MWGEIILGYAVFFNLCVYLLGCWRLIEIIFSFLDSKK